MSWEQLLEWFEYYQLEPFGEERADLRNGIACALLANVNRGRNSKAFSPTDFMPFVEKPQAKPMDAEGWKRLKSVLKSMAPRKK